MKKIKTILVSLLIAVILTGGIFYTYNLNKNNMPQTILVRRQKMELVLYRNKEKKKVIIKEKI